VIFVDTSAWYARYTPRDAYHAEAHAFHLNNRQTLITTDYVIDEALTLFKMRGNYRRAIHFGHRIFAGGLAQIVWIQPTDIEAAWSIFERFDDKQWSFTDCVSYVVLERLGIKTAFAFDEHFRQFGTVEVVPARQQ
jgi:predicted nucleic acid-binding protein